MAFTITGTGITFPDGTKFASSPTRGVHAGIRYAFSTSTDTTATPGNGNIRFNNGTFGSITQITVAGTNADEQDFEAFLDAIVDISAPEDNMLGYLFLVSNDDTANSSFNEAIFRVDTGVATKASGYVLLGVTPLSGSVFSNSESISLMFFPRGDRGDVGPSGPGGAMGAVGPQGPDAPSDERLKENARTIPNAAERLAKLKPSRFEWISNGDTSEGFLAQEILEIDNQLGSDVVGGDLNSNEMLSVDYGKITPLLTAALQEALIKIDELEKRIETLEKPPIFRE